MSAHPIFSKALVSRFENPPHGLPVLQVDLTGFDPNGIGLMGYDITPGKTWVMNVSMTESVMHALTQEDGYPGYGGVFLESFFGFSQAPPVGIESHPERQHFSTTSSTLFARNLVDP